MCKNIWKRYLIEGFENNNKLKSYMQIKYKV